MVIRGLRMPRTAVARREPSGDGSGVTLIPDLSDHVYIKTRALRGQLASNLSINQGLRQPPGVLDVPIRVVRHRHAFAGRCVTAVDVAVRRVHDTDDRPVI